MSKQGYKCFAWLPEHDNYLKANYVTLSNTQLGVALGNLNKELKLHGGDTTPRTADAVRKRLNELQLRRPKKSTLPKELRNVQHSFFDAINRGTKARNAKSVIEKKQAKHNRTVEKEKKWAETMGVAVQEKAKVWVTASDGARLLVPVGEEQKWLNKYENRNK